MRYTLSRVLIRGLSWLIDGFLTGHSSMSNRRFISTPAWAVDGRGHGDGHRGNWLRRLSQGKTGPRRTSSASPVTGRRRSEDVRRTLARANPEVHSVDLATSCVVNGQLLSESEQLEEGLALIVKGLQIAVERDFLDLVRVAIMLLRNLYQQNPSEVAETWRKATSTEPPEWMTQ
jgi:hypothetical protein